MIARAALGVGAVLAGWVAWAASAWVVMIAGGVAFERYIGPADRHHVGVLGLLVGGIGGSFAAGYVAGVVIRDSTLEPGPEFLWAANPAVWLSAVACLGFLVSGQIGLAVASPLLGTALAWLAHVGAKQGVRLDGGK